MYKETKRKGFNFFRSYFDVYNELTNPKDKIAFIDALLARQFLGEKPKKLTGMAKFAWISQVNSIDSQVKGYEDKTGVKLTPCQGGVRTPTEQVQVEVEEKEEEQEEVPLLIFPFNTDKFIEFWKMWKTYKKEEHKFNFKSLITEQAALKSLGELSNNNELTAIKIIEQSIANGYKGLFALKNKNNGKPKQLTAEERNQQAAEIFKRRIQNQTE